MKVNQAIILCFTLRNKSLREARLIACVLVFSTSLLLGIICEVRIKRLPITYAPKTVGHIGQPHR